MNLKGKKIVVIGMGKTGIASARFLGAQGALVIAVDEKHSEEWGKGFDSLLKEKWLTVGSYNPAVLENADMVVPSPGIPPRNEILSAALKANIPVISEIELAYRFLKVPIVAVTGTNGKTTTTSLLGEILKASGKKVFVGGNIGNPLIEYAETTQADDFIVAEISSFQLQWVDQFRPFIALLLNITVDHTDYHGSMDEYRRIKARVFANQTGADFAILNAADPEQNKIADSLCAKVARFNSQAEVKRGIFLKGDSLIYRDFAEKEEQYPLSMIKIPGLHNVENVMAATLAARFCGCDRDNIIQAVTNFRGLPHRIEYAGEKNGVRFYDDSKGTNVGSVVRALDTFPGKVILLLGGRDKDGDFETLRELLMKKAKRIILFGEARDRIGLLIGNNVPSEKKETLGEAIAGAYQNASAGDVILLSPGCASFDEFKNYKERGNYFKKEVAKL